MVGREWCSSGSPLPSSNLGPFGRCWYARGRGHFRRKPGSAPAGEYTLDSARAENSLISTSQGSAEPLYARIKGANLEISEGKTGLWSRSVFFLRRVTSSAWKSSTRAWTGPTAAMPWPLASKPKVAARAGGAGGVEATMAANAASATVKVTRRISDSRNISRSNSSISHGTKESSPCISCSTSESSPCISSGTSNISNRNRNSSTTGISRDISHISPHSIRGDGVHHAFVSGMISTGTFYQSRAVPPPTDHASF